MIEEPEEVETEMVTKLAHFIISGEFMTETARNLLLSDEPGKAYRLIANGLRGDGAIQAALTVLQGTHDLAGDSDSGLELVEAEDNEALRAFKADYHFIYAGRHRSKLGWRRPVAKVVRFGPKDGKWASGRRLQGANGSEALRLWAKERALYYCSADETAELLELPDGGKTYTIWESCSEAPHWVKPPNTFQEALDQALEAGRTLQERPSKIEREIEDQELRDEALATRASERETQRQQKAQDQRERESEELIRDIGEKVRVQAGDDTFVLGLKDGRKITVPRAPFIRWALCRTDLEDTAPDWENVAPVGVKMQLDNPDHTDWILGSGLTLGEAYNDNVNEPAWDAAGEFQEAARRPKQQYPGIMAAVEMLNNMRHQAATVVDAGERVGTIGVDIAVFPDSQGSRANQLDGIVGVIVEKGGALAHFALVSKGLGITVMCHPKACELFKEGIRIQLNPKSGRIVILENLE